MRHFVVRLIFSVGLLLVLPLSLYLAHWHWQPNQQIAGLHLQYWVTLTATLPWAALTSLMLLGWFLWRLNVKSLKQAMVITIVFLFVIVGGNLIKSKIKRYTQEPRPYITWLAQQDALKVKPFYHQTKQQQQQQLQPLIQRELPNVPHWQRDYWVQEVSYAFPSGHTLFAVSWALMAVLLLWARRYYWDVFVLFVWSIEVAWSRLALGMHWPEDVAMSIILAGLLTSLAGYYFSKKHPSLLKG